MCVWSKGLLTGDHETGATLRRPEPHPHSSFREPDSPEPLLSHGLFHLKAEPPNSDSGGDS